MQYLDSLNERQKEAAQSLEGPLLIIAGAGAGKTTTITHRIAHLMHEGVPGRSILAVTFTNKAAGEMRERVRSLLPEHMTLPLLTTFHALGVRILREFYQEANLARGFSIWDRDDSMRAIKRALETLEIEEWPARTILSIISAAKGDGKTPDELGHAAQNPKEQTAAKIWRMYEDTLRSEQALDFDDLLVRTLRLLRDSPTVLSRLQDRWHYITIDEYQDTNAAQYEIARLLAGQKKNLCVVGDIDQNIYSWRGADIAHLLAFEERFPGAKVVLLEQNYRSTRTILSAANGVIAKNVRRKEKNLFTENETGEPIAVYGARNEIDEAWYVAHTIRQLLGQGISAGEIAVLYRENFQSRTLEEALLAFDIPYRVLGTKFFDRKEVKDTLSYLRAARNPQSSVDITRIIATPPRGIGKVTLEKMLSGGDVSFTGATAAKVAAFKELMEKIRHATETLPASEAVRYVIEASGMHEMYKQDRTEGAERLLNLQELVNLAIRYDELTPPESIDKLLEDAALQSEQDELPAQEQRAGVSLMTVHASKGLEFDAVFVTGLEQGLFPSLRDNTRDSEEERRLFYVALTRARKRLFLTSATQRMKYGEREYTLPSEFLHDIDERLLEHRPYSYGTPEGLIT